MKSFLSRITLLFVAVLALQACKDDEGPGYIPLNIVANADSGEVFQNATLEIPVLANDSNVPTNGVITLTAPQSGAVSV